MSILITGVAGFIGYSLASALLKDQLSIVGIDNMNDYYDPALKYARLNRLRAFSSFKFYPIDIANRDDVASLFQQSSFNTVVHLAAQAGVRYSIENPHAYIDANIVGFCNILEGCRHARVSHLLFASTSSVYGANAKQPFSEHDSVNHPMALYAATKKANELMAHSYASLYNLPCTGLRFFTVYGPWGRPDMALFKFTQNILNDQPIDVFNHGNMTRDFTYIDDIVQGIRLTINHAPTPNTAWSAHDPDPASSYAPYKIYNIASNSPRSLLDYISTLEKALGKKAKMNKQPMQAGDVPSTYADISEITRDLSYSPKTSLSTGIKNFVDWYLEYYKPH